MPEPFRKRVRAATIGHMVQLREVTVIAAPLERVFDLARSIEVHLLDNIHFGEQATAGTRTGLHGMGEQVMWQARHFFVRQTLVSLITAFDSPRYFQDTMLRGAFRSMQHDHFFRKVQPADDGSPRTEMTDEFRFAAPILEGGLLAEFFVLRRYMRNLLRERNAVIKRVAESDEWQQYLPSVPAHTETQGVTP
ncbi:SRPBCC family protein [Granulicella mallensis]|uniref:Polyketide cyclase/dehydrase n=1 Tax=Granulicella mallensis (strain ATCC BAA-1857 / DSM 23137 / MP5ACTX8) TaxID=682795 RepID=G8NU66_GRAMM|nr:SRPBCC family protein [Granulicella mallensis]AEU38701.1 Polyketide cyclase/dehydrase [Granulicella mallensis MP5ACTX8]